MTLREEPNTFSNPPCETAVNGERVSGVEIRHCDDNPINGSKEYRCVHYSGQVITSVKQDLGNTVGEGNFTDHIFINSEINENYFMS